MQLLLIALSTLISEDLTCIAAGVLVAQRRLGFAQASMACLAGIFAGDVLLFLAGRFIGARALRWRLVTKFLSPQLVERGADWLQRRGLAVVILSRFTPGLRLPTYFAAGMLPTRFAAFASYFLIAAAVWTPLLVGATALFGEGFLSSLFAHHTEGLLAFVIVFATIAAAHQLVKPLLSHRGRRRARGFLMRKIRWEFWPMWAAYLPVVPYLLYLAVRHRSLTLFTAANPGIASGGFVGESKSRILRHLEDFAPSFALIPAGQTIAAPEFPVVLKPDVGERGSGVAVIRSGAEFDAYLRNAQTDTILQQYAGGLEFGVFYYRRPSESHGRVFSITQKVFPTVTGDGKRTLLDLILDDSRAVSMASAYERVSKRDLDDVPADGEEIQLVEIGSHCRGAVFLNGMHLLTPALESTIDQISQSHPGFYFGRFDIRTPSAEAFARGEGLSVIELNGVSAEATHIYDPSVSLYEAYRVLFEQWRLAFEIGAENRALGFAPMALSEFVTLVSGRSWGLIRILTPPKVIETP